MKTVQHEKSELDEEIQMKLEKDAEQTLAAWLDRCPSPVVARVISESLDIRWLATCASLYDPKTLVVVPISALREFENIYK